MVRIVYSPKNKQLNTHCTPNTPPFVRETNRCRDVGGRGRRVPRRMAIRTIGGSRTSARPQRPSRVQEPLKSSKSLRPGIDEDVDDRRVSQPLTSQPLGSRKAMLETERACETGDKIVFANPSRVSMRVDRRISPLVFSQPPLFCLCPTRAV